MRFGSYNLNKELVDALTTLGYVEATPIQEKVLAKALKGKSLICKSETGSGKTHAFLIPILNNIDKTLNKVQALVISPTVELAHQTYEFAKKICDKIEGLSCKEISSSSDKNINLEQLAFGGTLPKLLIGTPGRLFDLFVKERKDCSAIKTIVLDEADMLIDNSYIEEIDALISTISPSQRLVFTATMKEHLIADTYKFVKAEEIIDIDRKIKVNRNVSHHLVNIKHKDVIEQLISFLKIKQPYFTMVFASEKTRVEMVYKKLNEEGIPCSIINGNMESRERKIMMRRINNGEFNLVICSDIASRGIDLEHVSTVISLDLPYDLDYYYHRAGRTGRNQNTGDSYIFYNDEDMNKINKLIQNGLNFDYFVLRNDTLKQVSSFNPSSKPKKESDVLKAQIKKEIAKVRTTKVKPGYKKKIKKAVEKAKKEHKEKIIKKNIKEKKKAQEKLF